MFTPKTLVASLLGGVTIFLWGAISHTLIPFSENALLGFTDEDVVVQAIATAAPRSGVYFLPYMPQRAQGMTEEQFNEAKKVAEEKMARGPFMLASVRVGPMGSFVSYLVTQLLTDILSALCVCLVFANARGVSFWAHVAGIVFVGLAGFCAVSLPQWNWYAFSTAFTLAELFDTVVGFFLGGIVIARFNPVSQQ